MKEEREAKRAQLDGRHDYILSIVASCLGLEKADVEDAILEGNQVLYTHIVENDRNKNTKHIGMAAFVRHFFFVFLLIQNYFLIYFLLVISVLGAGVKNWTELIY